MKVPQQKCALSELAMDDCDRRARPCVYQSDEHNHNQDVETDSDHSSFSAWSSIPIVNDPIIYPRTQQTYNSSILPDIHTQRTLFERPYIVTLNLHQNWSTTSVRTLPNLRTSLEHLVTEDSSDEQSNHELQQGIGSCSEPAVPHPANPFWDSEE
ncbi:uncharacterized protein LOC100372123 [Saccoglossus kowalevskii]